MAEYKISEQINEHCDGFRYIQKVIQDVEDTVIKLFPEYKKQREGRSISLFEILEQSAMEGECSVSYHGACADKIVHISLAEVNFEKTPHAMLEDVKARLKDLQNQRENAEVDVERLKEEVLALSKQENLKKIIGAVRHTRDVFECLPKIILSIKKYYPNVDKEFYGHMDYAERNILEKINIPLDNFIAEFETVQKQIHELKMTFPELKAEYEQDQEIHAILNIINPYGYLQLHPK
jgi:hypothetical protein